MFQESAQSALLPVKMSAAIVAFDQFTPGWTLAETADCTTETPRRFVSTISFESPFSVTPLVHVAIAGFDVDHRDSARLSLCAESISMTGFDIVVQTWQHSRVYKVEVSWLALGS